MPRRQIAITRAQTSWTTSLHSSTSQRHGKRPEIDDGGQATDPHDVVGGLEAAVLPAFQVATRWRHDPKIGKPPKGGFLKNLIKTEACLVAGIGFEPMTFRL